jgi:argininosuccinate lyase
MQEDKEGVFDSVETADISLRILNEALATMSVNISNMEAACEVGHLSATDLADYLASKCGIPFRDAYKITGSIVVQAEKSGVDISQMSLEELKVADSRIGEDVLDFLNLRNSMNARNSQGGTSQESTKTQISYFKDWLRDYAK